MQAITVDKGIDNSASSVDNSRSHLTEMNLIKKNHCKIIQTPDIRERTPQIPDVGVMQLVDRRRDVLKDGDRDW